MSTPTGELVHELKSQKPESGFARECAARIADARTAQEMRAAFADYARAVAALLNQ